MALQLRRGTNQQRLGLTPVEGEMIYVTDNVLVSISVTSINTSTETLTTSVEHGLILNQQIKFIGATLNGLTKDQVYYVKTTPSTTSFTLSATSGGDTLNITGTYSVPLVFAKTPCLANGAPVGYDVSPLWAGDGITVGGNPAGAILLDELRDVVITTPNEGQTLYYDDTDAKWENTNILQVDDTATFGGILVGEGITQPMISFPAQADGVNAIYGIRGKSSADDAWFVGSGSAGDDQGYIEIATGDNAGGDNNGGQIYVRQYNGSGGANVPWYGGTGTVERELVLLNDVGYTSIPLRLGINNTSPNYALDVNGTANIETSLTVPSITTLTGDNLNIAAYSTGTSGSGKSINITATNVSRVSSTSLDGLNLIATNCENPISVTRNTGLTDASTRVLALRIDSTGTPGINGSTGLGLGGSLQWQIENASEVMKEAAFIDVSSTNLTAGSETFRMAFGLMNAGATHVAKMELDGSGNLQIDGQLEVDGNVIKSSTATAITLSGANVDIAGTLEVTGNQIKNSSGSSVITFDGNELELIGDLQIKGNKIRNSTGNDTITMGTGNAGLVTLSGNLQVSGNEIKSSGGTTAITLSSSDATIAGSLTAANYNTNNTGTISLFNSNATGANVLGDATGTISIGNTSGTLATNGKLNVGITLQTPSKEDVANAAAMSIGTASSYFSTGATGETATLAAGNEGQFKSLAMKAHGGGNMVVTVTNAGWKGGASGTITFGNVGDACLLHYIDGRWYAVGSTDVPFA